MKEIPVEIQDARDHWKTMRKVWRATHYCLGLSGIFCSVAAASEFFKVVLIADWLPALFTLIAAVCFGCMAFLLPSHNALAYERALIRLEREMMKYQHGDKYALNFVIDAKREGESIISNKNLIGQVGGDT